MNDIIIGKYRVIRKIGAGGMASVFLAVHKDIPNLHVVLKKLGDPELVERFKREADKLAALDGHPGICQIKHFFDHDDVFYIAMEYIDGQTLQELVEGEGPLDLGQALLLARTILDILESAHSLGICHRDIKPTNIMIDKKGNLKIIDFGLAKSDSDPQLTHVGTSLGSPLYMAPEQFNPSEGLNYIPCDLYAVGIALYFMLTGHLPHSGNNLYQIIEAKGQAQVPRPTLFNPDIPPGVEATILKAIAHDPRDRFASAAEMKSALVSGPRNIDDILEKYGKNTTSAGEATVILNPGDQTVASIPLTRDMPTSQGSGARRRFRAWMVPVGVLALAALGFALESLLTGSPDDGARQTESQLAGSPAPVDSIPPATGDPDLSSAGDVHLDDQPVDHALAGSPPARQTPRPATESSHASPAQAARGELVVGSWPVLGAGIFVNGVDTQHTTPFTLSLGAGEYKIKVVLITDGVPQEQEESIQITAGQSQKKIFRFN